MRKANRDINIFSVSALDLFCSAMGAMIVLSVVLMPSYRKDVELSDVEIVFVVDNTGSMGNVLHDLKKDIGQTVTALHRMSNKLKIGFVAYNDIGETGEKVDYELNEREKLQFPDLEETFEVPVVPLLHFEMEDIPRGNPDENEPLIRLKRFINGVWPLSTNANEELEEAVYLGLEKAVASGFGWTQDPGADVRQLIILIADAGPYVADRAPCLDLVKKWKMEAPEKRYISGIYSVHPIARDASLAQSEEQAKAFSDAAKFAKPFFQEISDEGRYFENPSDLMGSILDSVLGQP